MVTGGKLNETIESREEKVWVAKICTTSLTSK